MGSATNHRRVRVERGIYMQPNGNYAVCCRHAGRLRFRTVGSEIAEARRQRAVLIAAVRRGVVPVSPRLRFDTVAGWWLERFEAKVAAGERHPRTLEAHRYQLDRHLLPALAARRVASITADDVADLLLVLPTKGCWPRRPQARWRRCRASCATPAATAGSRLTRSTSSSPTSVPGRRVVASACWVAMRSSGCWRPARRAIE
jgi:hypothetical protein